MNFEISRIYENFEKFFTPVDPLIYGFETVLTEGLFLYHLLTILNDMI